MVQKQSRLYQESVRTLAELADTTGVDLCAGQAPVRDRSMVAIKADKVARARTYRRILQVRTACWRLWGGPGHLRYSWGHLVLLTKRLAVLTPRPPAHGDCCCRQAPTACGAIGPCAGGVQEAVGLSTVNAARAGGAAAEQLRAACGLHLQ
jgi:hypothetical protein